MTTTAHEEQFITHPDDLPAEQPMDAYDTEAAFDAAPPRDFFGQAIIAMAVFVIAIVGFLVWGAA